MSILEQIAYRIVKDQELIMGGLAIEEAAQVGGLAFEKDKSVIHLSGDQKTLVDQLVSRYEHLFGLASIQVCKDAAAPLLPELAANEVPQSLK